MAKYKKQKDGRYHTTISTGQFTADGKPINKSLAARTIHELDEKVAEYRHQSNVNALIFDSATTFEEFSIQWLKVTKKGKSIATNAMYENVFKHFDKINNVPLQSVSRIALQNIINDNIEHPRICQQIKMTLKQIFAYALSEHLVNSNPAEMLELPRRVVGEKRALTKEEIEKIRNAVLPLDERVLISTFYGSGMRPSEIYALTKQDIDFKNGCINVNKSLTFDGSKPVVTYPKTNSGIRSVIIAQSLTKLIKSYVNTLDHDILFADAQGNYRTKSGYANWYNTIMSKIFKTTNKQFRKKDNRIAPYTFRHNFCTLLYYNGVSLKEAQRQMGHSSYNLVLSVYSHLDAEKENTKSKMDAICL